MGGKNYNGECVNDFMIGGMDFKKLEGMIKLFVMSDEELDYYVDEYMKYEVLQL